jgi:hypothetical protein
MAAKGKQMGLTVASKTHVTELADKLYTLLVEHGNIGEASCALELTSTMWESMPFQNADQRAKHSMGLEPDIIADWASRL